MTSVNCLVGLRPPTTIYERILQLRKEIPYHNFFGGSEPHITLYANTFPSIEEVEDKVKKILLDHKAFAAKVQGFHCFGYDSFTAQHTLVYIVERTPELLLTLIFLLRENR